jgi:hypothetical protein
MDQIAAQLPARLARGGRALQEFGISLDSDAVKAKAAEIAMADGREEVSRFDLVAAGAALTTAQLGDSIGRNVAEGSKSGVIQLRSFKTAISETIEGLGAPLIGPILDMVRSVGPPLGQLAVTIGTALQAVVPIFSRIVQIIGPFITANLGGLNILLTATAKAIQLIDNFLDPIFDKIGKFAGFIGGAIGKVLDYVGAIDTETPKAQAATQATDQWATSTDRAGQQADETKAQVGGLQDKIKEHADAIIATMPSVAAAFEKATADSKVSLKELQDALAEQIKAEQQFFSNLNYIAATGSLTLVEELSKMGPARGAAAAKAIADSTPAQVQALERQIDDLKALEARGGTEIGTQLAAGVDAGVREGLKKVEAAFADLKKVASNIFQARSPSRWAIGLGSDIAAGLAAGIEQTTPRVEAALTGITGVGVPTPSGPVGRSVTVAQGAVQITIAAPITPGAVGEVEAAVDRALGRLVQEIGRH